MRPELKRLLSPDAPTFPDWAPDDPSDFVLYLEAEIGPSGEDGADIFGFTACTPSALSRMSEANGYAWGLHKLVLRRYDSILIRDAIVSLCRRLEGEDWQDISGKLARYGAWEFEDYRSS